MTRQSLEGCGERIPNLSGKTTDGEEIAVHLTHLKKDGTAWLQSHMTEESIRVQIRSLGAQLSEDAERDTIRKILNWWPNLSAVPRMAIRVGRLHYEARVVHFDQSLGHLLPETDQLAVEMGFRSGKIIVKPAAVVVTRFEIAKTGFDSTRPRHNIAHDGTLLMFAYITVGVTNRKQINPIEVHVNAPMDIVFSDESGRKVEFQNQQNRQARQLLELGMKYAISQASSGGLPSLGKIH